MIREWEYQVNEAEMLVEDFQVLGAPVPCCYAKMIDRNGTIQLCKTLNCIREENNRMAIQRNRYFIMDLHFSRAPPLDRRDSLFICEKLIFRKVGVATYFIFERENKTRNKTLKKGLQNSWKKHVCEKPKSEFGDQLLIGKVPLKGSTPLSPIKVCTNKVKGSVAINQLIMDT